MNRTTRLLMLVMMAVLPAGPAWAAWPEKPIRVVVPYSPGSMGDVLIRLISDDLRRSLGQPVIVDNRPGAGGNIGTAAVAQAAPDGYTLLVGATNNFVINQSLYPQMKFDPLKALEPITIIADVPSVIFVSEQVPATTFAEFVRYAKANPGKINYGSPGTGTTPHLFTERMNRAMSLNMTHVPYKGSGQGMTALVSNEVQLYVAGAGLGMQHVKGGKARALAISSASRLPLTPETPTFAEVGLDAAQAGNWWGLAAPAGTPPAILTQINEAVRKALATPAVRSGLAQLGVIGVGSSRDDMARQLAEEARTWSRVVKELGVTVD